MGLHTTADKPIRNRGRKKAYAIGATYRGPNALRYDDLDARAVRAETPPEERRASE